MEVQGHAELPRNTSAVQPASSHSELAPYYPVPACRLVSVEHPFDIRNVARAIESLGGSKGVGKDSLGCLKRLTFDRRYLTSIQKQRRWHCTSILGSADPIRYCQETPVPRTSLSESRFQGQPEGKESEELLTHSKKLKRHTAIANLMVYDRVPCLAKTNYYGLFMIILDKFIARVLESLSEHIDLGVSGLSPSNDGFDLAV
ncbi:MAG: hypothetical protein LQ340_000909 [Diploschistes diacapsis]|nr:MAG: hypothetical protein LQ340_000909 [Diploschistes diacapsis]